jgi:hypothetical protein
VFKKAGGPDPVIYVFLVQYNWRTEYWSLYLCCGQDSWRTGPWNWYLSPCSRVPEGMGTGICFMSLVVDSWGPLLTCSRALQPM